MTMSVDKLHFQHKKKTEVWERHTLTVTPYFLHKSRSMNIFYVVISVTIKDKDGKNIQFLCRLKEVFVDQYNYFVHSKSFCWQK